MAVPPWETLGKDRTKEELFLSIKTEQKFLKSIKSVKSYKSAGKDGIFPGVLQKSFQEMYY